VPAKIVSCLITESLKAAPAQKATDGREATFRDYFATIFAERMAKHYGELAKFTAEKGDVSLKNLPGAPGTEFENGYQKYRQQVVKVSTVYAYSIAPKESFDRIDADSSRSNELGAALAVSPTPTVRSRAAVSAVGQRARESSASAIERAPRIVGFTGVAQDAAYFGWIIGPQFRAVDRAEAGTFEQTVGHYVVSAIISAPAWWTRAHVSVATYWYDGRSGTCVDDTGTPLPCSQYENWKSKPGPRITEFDVMLPVDPRPLGDILLAGGGARGGADALKQPAIDKDRMEPVGLAAGSRAEIVVPGHNLWRNPLVTLGSQQATRVKLLPNMNGLVAYFDEVTAPPGWDGVKPYDQLVLTVWTSQKNADSVKGKVILYPKSQVAPEAAAPQPKAQVPSTGRQASSVAGARP